MKECWNDEKESRPNFLKLKEAFDGLIAHGERYNYLQLLACENEIAEEVLGPAEQDLGAAGEGLGAAEEGLGATEEGLQPAINYSYSLKTNIPHHI